MPSNHALGPFIRVSNLRFRYPGMHQDALWIAGLEIGRPGLVAITGVSGAGKSTLVELLAGTLSAPYLGSVQVLGREWSQLRTDRTRQFHLRRIGLIPQDLGLLPDQTPRQMLRRALLDADVPEGQCEARISGALSQVDLGAYADRRTAELSGGQRQRVALARALVRNVELILADEPTANLSPALTDEVIALLKRIGEAIPVVIVTHDPRVAQACVRQITLAAPTATTVAATTGAAVAAERVAPRRPYRRATVLSAAGASGLAGLVGLFAVLAGASPSSVARHAPAPRALPAAVPAAAAPVPQEPQATALPAAQHPARPAVAVASRPKPRPSTPVAAPPPAPAPASSVQPPAPTPAPVAQPAAAPTPSYLEWWQSMSQLMGVPAGSPPRQPAPAPSPTPSSTPTSG